MPDPSIYLSQSDGAAQGQTCSQLEMTSRTRRAPKRAAVSPAIRTGLEALVQGNESVIAGMLSVSEQGVSEICDELEKVVHWTGLGWPVHRHTPRAPLI